MLSITQEVKSRRDTLQRVWASMQNFAQGLRNELDENYWSEHRIAFFDLKSAPQFNQFRFNYSELEKLFDISTLRETLLSYRKLSEEKQRLEVDLGISMDRVSGRR